MDLKPTRGLGVSLWLVSHSHTSLHELCELGKLIKRHSNQTNLGVKAYNYILSA